MRIFRKITNRTAQHTIEYTVLLILIMAGIIISSPYVVRSWNANLKGWSDSVQDSIQDPLLEEPLPPPLPGCEPGERIPVGCGGSSLHLCTGQQFECPEPTQMLFRQRYYPDGCQCVSEDNHNYDPDYLSCEYDDACCVYEPGECAPAEGCPVGTRSYERTCGNGNVETVCGYMPGGPETFVEGDLDPKCFFSCQTPPEKIIAPDIGYGEVCAGDEDDLTNNTTHYSYVNEGECTDEKKCEIECDPDFLSYGDFCDCEYGLDITGCPAGEFNPGDCDPGYFDPCCLAPPGPLKECLPYSFKQNEVFFAGPEWVWFFIDGNSYALTCSRLPLCLLNVTYDHTDGYRYSVGNFVESTAPWNAHHQICRER